VSEQEVVTLMKSSKSAQEWDANCSKVKAACNGYPPFWYAAVVLSGLMREVTATFGGDDKIHISVSRE
jgi:hypothetical protein